MASLIMLLPSVPISLYLILLILLVHIPPYLSSYDNNNYTSCASHYDCGEIKNISFPFWGQNRPSFCGHPLLQLNCDHDQTYITIKDVRYKVLDAKPDNHTLRIVREDYFHGLFCPSKPQNTSLDTNLFVFGPENKDLSLFYDCNQGSNVFPFLNCFSNDTSNQYFYPLFGGFGPPPVICTTNVVVPVLLDIVDFFKVKEAIEYGFLVRWIEGIKECEECLQSGGACGYDLISKGAACFCRDQYALDKVSKTCAPSTNDQVLPNPGSSSNKVGIVAGAVGGIAALAVVLGCLCFVARRRRKNVEQSRSKDTFTLPSSTTPATSTTNLSQSDSSFASSKSDPMPRSFYFGVQVFTIQELEEATKNFDSSRELGEGGFGTVYKGILQDGRVVAVKRHYESNFKRVGQFMNEVEILARLRHKNLVTLFGCTSRHSRELLLVYEYIPNGTLADHLHGRSSKSTLLPWVARFNIAMETAEALAYLHGKDVIHRDVKSNNILLTDKFQVKVADFGLSRLFPNDVTHVSTAPQGTPGYVDPEYYQNYQLTDKSDVYSFGVVLIELISSLQAVDITRHRNDVNLANMAVNKIQNQELHELVDPYLGFAKDNAIRRMAIAVAELAFRCLQQEKDMRPSMDEVLETLKEIKSDEFSAQGTETCVDVKTEETVPLKKVPLPISPDSVTDNWVSGSSASSYS